MIINLSKIDFGGVATGGKSKPEEQFDVQPTTSDQTITPTEGSVFSGGTVRAVTSEIDNNIIPGNIKQGVSILGVAGTLEEGITPAGTKTITDNGTYDVTTFASVDVEVSGDTPDYRYMKGTADRAGLRAIGWTDEDILTYEQNTPPHYSWQNDQYKVSDENKALYLLDDPNPSSYKDNPNIEYVPKKNMESYFAKSSGFREMKYIKGIPFYDTSNVTDATYLFFGCASLKTIPQLDTSKVTKMDNTFAYCYNLQSIPQLDTSNVTFTGAMFYECHSLTAVPQLNTSKVTNMGSMFHKCNSLVAVPQLDTSNATNMSYLFGDCINLTEVPQLDTSKATDIHGIFKGCSKLTTVPQLDTSKATDIYDMFWDCSSLTTVPQLDTSNAKYMSGMFTGCEKLTTIPQLNTSNAVNMQDMFRSCKNLTTIPPLDTSNVIGMSYMFEGCSNLTTIPPLDTSKCGLMERTFYNCNSLTTVEGFDFSGFTSSSPRYLFGYSSNMPKITRFIVNGKINVSMSDNYSIRALSAIDYDSVKSILAAADRTDNNDAKELAFNRTMTDQNGELAALVASCSTKGWTITGLTLQ